MPLGSVDVHYKAQQEAMKAGPRIFRVGNQKVMGYGLTKAELKRQFLSAGYNTLKGSRWRSAILEWTDKDLFGDFVSIPTDVLLDKKETRDWCVIFVNMAVEEMDKLKATAERESAIAYPSELHMRYAICPIY